MAEPEAVPWLYQGTTDVWAPNGTLWRVTTTLRLDGTAAAAAVEVGDAHSVGALTDAQPDTGRR